MTGTTATKRSRSANGVASLEQWSGAAIHEITCPSGTRVKIKLPDLEGMLAGDALPEHLRAVAFKEVADEIRGITQQNGEEPASPEINPEIVKKGVELRDWIVVATVVEPQLTMADLPSVPAEDRTMISSLAMRELDTDARGVTLGVAPLSRFRIFREIHECAEDCAACEEVRSALSTSGHGQM